MGRSAYVGASALLLTLSCLLAGQANSAQYVGKFIAKLSELHHGVSGEVYAVDGRTLHIKDFTYDGQGPAAYFYASAQGSANGQGFRLRDENGKGDVIRKYRKEGVTLTLPEGKTLNNIRIFYVWCEEFSVNFGDVKIPRGFEFPRPQKLEAMRGVHGISSDPIVIVDAQTLLIPSLSYDGEAPDAKFWVGRGSKPSPQGIRVPDENGKELPLRRYDRKTIVLTLPGDLTVFDIGHFGIWCEQFTVDFGHVLLPQNMNIPPSLKMLGVSPQSKLNCEVLNDELAFEVRWAIAGESIVLQLVAKLEPNEYMSFGPSADVSKSIMIGGDVAVAWVDRETLKGFAVDYYLADKSQCSGPSGSCPDTKFAEKTNSIRLLNSAMVNGYSIVTYQRPLRASDEYDHRIYTNGSQAILWAVGPLNQRGEVSFHSSYLKKTRSIDFGRPAKWNCPMPESEIPMRHTSAAAYESRTYLPKVAEVTAATAEAPAEDAEVGQPPKRQPTRRAGNRRQPAQQPVIEEEEQTAPAQTRQQNRRGSAGNRGGQGQRGSGSTTNAIRAVPPPTPVKKRDAWDIPPIRCYEPEDGVFYAQMGPTGGKHGYPAITGHVGWGISWYINGLLIPEINLVRGKTYTFVVEGGDDPEVSAKYHPFYITDDPVGGYEYKTPEEKKQVQIYAGARKAKDGTIAPTGTGRLCHWTQTGDIDADDFVSFGAYQRTLELKCDQGEPGVIQWTPDKYTPDTVYYQCFTHRYLGWKINVHDSCDEQPAGSEQQATIVEAPEEIKEEYLEESPSIQVEKRVKPNDIPESSESKPQFIVSEIDVDTFPRPQQGPDDTDERYTNTERTDITTSTTQETTSTTATTPETTTTTETTSKTTTTETTSTTTTTETHSSNTTSTPPVASSRIIVANDTILVPHSGQLKDDAFFLPPPPPNFLRRPPPFQFVRTPQRPYVPHPIPFKKPVFRPIIKGPPHLNRPYRHNKPLYYPKPQPIFIANLPLEKPTYKHEQVTNVPIYPQYHPPIMTKSPPIHTRLTAETSNKFEVMNVEVSPQQASTEREPIETQTSSSLVAIQPIMAKEPVNLRPAYNTGFKPETINMESGFKPIVTRDIQDRIDEPEIELESEVGVIKLDDNRFETKIVQSFEPMFVPSPTDKIPKVKYVKIRKRPLKKKPYKIMIQTRSLKDSDVEPTAEANERVDAYYLPPSGQNRKPVESARHHSNIDIEPPTKELVGSPPAVVITFDGKKVSGASLSIDPFARSNVLNQRGTKAQEYVKARPQSVPFKGDLPPLDRSGLAFKNMGGDGRDQRVLHRELESPPPPPAGTTKLRRVDRSKREAHHTPEHTAEQAIEMVNGTMTSGASNNVCMSGLVVVVYVLKYLYWLL